jgi:AraC family transcriptional regulator
MEKVRIYDFPKCKMVSSGIIRPERFLKWAAALPRQIFPRYFFYVVGDDGYFPVRCGMCIYENGMDVPDEFDIIDFKGGLYAVTTFDVERDSNQKQYEILNEFCKAYNCEFDNTRDELRSIYTTPKTKKVLGYEQMDIYTPIRQVRLSSRKKRNEE